MEENNIENITKEQMKNLFKILEKEFYNILNLINNIVGSEVFKEFKKSSLFSGLKAIKSPQVYYTIFS